MFFWFNFMVFKCLNLEFNGEELKIKNDEVEEVLKELKTDKIEEIKSCNKEDEECLTKEEKLISKCDSLKSFEEYHKKLEESILSSIKLHKDFILKTVQEYREFSVLVKSMNQFILKDKGDVDKMKKMAKKYETSSSEIIKLNVGGTMFSTLKATLERKIKRLNGEGYYDPHLLQSLLSGTIKINYDENKAIFIDRNPKYFIHILDYLRSLDGNQIRQKLDKQNLNEFLTEIEYYELEGLFESVYNYMDSLIVDDIYKIAKLKKLFNFQSSTKWKLLYRASVDGFRAADFHRKCDNNANALTIIKTTENYIFGGYTKATWNQHSTYQPDLFLVL